MYERVFSRTLADTGDEKKAATQAVRDSKVPIKNCREFLTYRWAMILANLRVNKGKGMEPLTIDERKAIHQKMVKAGHLSKKELKEAVTQATGSLSGNNVDTCFLVPRSEDALKLRPSQKEKPSGRAPYSRQVMKEAISDVFAGNHPNEEGFSLYRSEAVKQAQLNRALDEKTNNHLVRHRILITRRLVQDIIKTYADGKADEVEQITIEVNRDIQAFSGMTNKEIEGELNQMLKDHSNVVKKLEKDLAESGKPYRVTAGLIRKARIAEDMGWKCPYTGKDYDTLDLASGAYDKDHIIPRALRPSDSLDSLVITSKAVNAMKGKRTAFEFMRDFGGRDIEGGHGVGKQKSNLSTKAEFIKFVEKLSIKSSHSQDRARKKKRKDLLLLERYEEKTFLPKDLTQTSHLVRLAATELEKEFLGLGKKPRVISLPGSVTGEIRKGWKLYGCLAAHNPEVEKLLARAETEELNIKKELRDITHQHHALDACVIGLASHFLPNEGNIWEILTKRNRNADETERLLGCKIFSRDSEGRAQLTPLRDELKQQIANRLAECRVVQHIPKRMDGLTGLEENTRGIMSIDIPDLESVESKQGKGQRMKTIWDHKSGEPLPILESLDGVMVELRQKGPRDEKNGGKRIEKDPTTEKASKLLGLRPENGSGKLRAIKGVRVINSNFGLALWKKDGKPDGETQMRIILWHKVWPQLKAIAEKENGGKWPQVLRNGELIHVPHAQGRSDYRGYWQIVSIKNNESGLAFDIVRPDMTKIRNKVDWAGINVSANTLIKCGLTAVSAGLTGVSLKL